MSRYLAYDRDASAQARLGELRETALSLSLEIIDTEKLRALAHGAEKVDVALVCNVPHEIDPFDWEKTLKDELAAVIAPDGFALIVEDQRMPIGERAHASGFLVLPEAATAALFQGSSASDYQFPYLDVEGREKRFSAALVPQAC